MPEQHGIRREADRLRDDVPGRHRAELGVDEMHVVSVVEQRTADRKQPSGGRWSSGMRLPIEG
jgi:hypothetical protein